MMTYPYAATPVGWPPENVGDPFDYRFGFVAVNETLSPDLGEVPPGPGTGALRLNEVRRDTDLLPPTDEFMFDTIEAAWLLDRGRDISACSPANPDERRIRATQLAELLLDEKLSIVTLLLSKKDPTEANFIANFLPSTWHRLVIGPDEGLPVLVADDEETLEPAVRRLFYAGPATPAENEMLCEIFSLNHVPDAGARLSD